MRSKEKQELILLEVGEQKEKSQGNYPSWDRERGELRAKDVTETQQKDFQDRRSREMFRKVQIG